MKAKTDFSKLPVGTKVWSSIYGHGEIIGRGSPDSIYPITVDFGYDNRPCFTKYGVLYLSDKYPSLFLKPLPGFEDGTAFESEMPDERIGKKCIFWNYPQGDFTISSLKDICGGDYIYLATNGCEYLNCVLYTPENIVELTEKL